MKLHTGILLISLNLLAACSGSGDGAGNTDDSNNPPSIVGTPASIVRAGDEYLFTPAVTDPDGDMLTFTIANKPEWAYFDAASGTVSGYPQMADYGKHQDIIISVFDGRNTTTFSFTVEVLPMLLGRDNFSTEGIVIPTADGYHSSGNLVMTINGKERHFEDSELQLSFDAEGNLVELVGETIVPQSVSDNLSLDAQVKTTVGLFSGAEINANSDIDIMLKDEMYYFVYYFGESLDITVGDRNGSGALSSLTLETPLGGEILFITDPTDVFYYYFAVVPFAGEAGYGESDIGLIPFVPQLDYAELDTFDGHVIENGAFGIGFKIFDFFNISGFKVTHQPEFSEIDLDDPLNSPIEFKMGLNGQAEFAFGILGFGLFSFDLAETSATLDVGFDRQQMTMQTVIAPDVSWVPPTFAFVPVSETVGDWFINGNGNFSATLSSSFESKLPEAMLVGSMQMDNENVVLTGTVNDGDRPLGVTATFFDNGVSVEVAVYADFNSGISQTVTMALDEKLVEVQQAFDDLQQATTDYEFELSLRGLRKELPGIADTGITILNAIPGTVRNEVDSAIVSYVDNYETCVDLGILGKSCTNPLDPVVNEQQLGDEKGEVARKQAADAIAPYTTALVNLKSAANAASDEQFRTAIASALEQAYNYRSFSKKIKITVSFPLGIGNKTVYDKTVTKTIISEENADKIKFALDNVGNIEATSNIMISAQQVYDALPIEDSINSARQEVEDGIAQIPMLDGVGYTVESGDYSAYAILDGKNYEVDFNVLSPSELVSGIGRLISEQLL